MSTASRLTHALAELAYSIAYADGLLEDSEMAVFEERTRALFGHAAETLSNSFRMLGKRSLPNPDQAYRNAMFAIKEHRGSFDSEMRSRFIEILEQLAGASGGLREGEKQVVERFKEDIEHI